ncbi:MAG: nucleoside hydrolase [Lachnospiraceae bacterium]|nr:nucleoside hydrolase [Lachnospiraceae bacterium]
MGLLYDVPEEKRIRVIVDTDAACEADDPFAIAHALMTKKFEVKGVFAEQFLGTAGTMEKSLQEIQKILECMELDVPVFRGNDGALSVDNSLSEAGEFLVAEAMREDARPLFVLCLGAITNVAAALQKHPEIAKRMTIIWIGGHNLDLTEIPFREFNSGNDIEAANLVMKSEAELWLVPSNVYTSMHISLAEIQDRIAGCGAIGKHLFEQMVEYNNSPAASWTKGESWSLGDSPAVGIAMNPDCGTYVYREAPIFNEDTSARFDGTGRKIRVYTSVDSRFILEDLIAKLRILYGE